MRSPCGPPSRPRPARCSAVLGPNGSGKSTLLGAVAGLTPLSRWPDHPGRGQVLDDAGDGTFVEAAARARGFRLPGALSSSRTSACSTTWPFSPARGPAVARRGGRPAWLTGWAWPSCPADGRPTCPVGRPSGWPWPVPWRVTRRCCCSTSRSSALDARTRLDVQTELKRHLADFAGPCLLVTHDPLEALVLADRLLVLEHGRVVQEGTPAEVARRPATEYVARLVGLNLYAGTADGAHVALHGGGGFVVPDHHERGEVLVALRPSAVVVSTTPRSSPACATPGRRRSRVSRCSPTGCGSTSWVSRRPWWTSRRQRSRSWTSVRDNRCGCLPRRPSSRSTARFTRAEPGSWHRGPCRLTRWPPADRDVARRSSSGRTPARQAMRSMNRTE